MKTSELRLLSVEELRTRLADARQELMNLRFQVVTGQLTDTSRLQVTRRNIARLETILTEASQMLSGLTRSASIVLTTKSNVRLKHIEFVRAHHQLHAAVVHDDLAVFDLRVIFGDVADGLEKQAV